MRGRARATILAGVAVIVVAAAAAAADVLTPFGGLVPGSSSALIPPRDGLVLAPDQPPCPPPAPSTRCTARYAFTPDRELGVWISVRNGGPREITVDGAEEWIRSLPPDFMIRPTALLDGGDPSRGFTGTGAPFVPIALAPGAERLIGIRLRTTSDVRLACERWAPGTAVGLSEIPVSWHWLAKRHATSIPLMRDVLIASPNPSDCAR